MSTSSPKVIRSGDLTHFLASLFAAAIGLISTLVAARYLDPVDLGMIQAVMTIGAYFAYVDLGVSSGLLRILPQLQGAGELAEARAYAGVAWWVTRLVLWLGVGISGLTSVYGLATGQGVLFQWTVLGLVALLTAGTAETFYTILFRGCQRFAELGARMHWKNAVNLVLSILPVFLGRAGLLIRNVLLPLAGWMLVRRGLPVAIEPRKDWGRIRALIKTGGPILVLNAVSAYLAVADRSVIAIFLGKEPVGHYALSALLLTGFQVLPASLGSILYPRAAEALGRSNSSQSLGKIFLVSLGFNLGALIPMAVVFYWWIEPAIGLYLPKYALGAQAAKHTCLGAPFLGYMGVANILVVLRRTIHLNVILFVSLLVSWGWGSWLLRTGGAIDDIAWMRLWINGAVFFAVTGYAGWLVSRNITVKE